MVQRHGSSFNESRCKLYQGRTTPAVIFIAMIAASGGLLFGFDNGITGGTAVSLPYVCVLICSFILSGASALARNLASR